MAKGAGLKELKRLFGNVVAQKGDYYEITFPPKKEDVQVDLSSAAYDEGFSFDHGDEESDGPILEGEALQEDGYLADVPSFTTVSPKLEAYKALTAIHHFSANDIKTGDKERDDVLLISRHIADNGEFIMKLKKIPDQYFYDLTGADTLLSVPQRVLAKLNSLHKDVQWKIDEIGKQVVYTTTTPVPNRKGVMYILTEHLGIPMEEVDTFPYEPGFPALPVRVIDSKNIDRFENLNPMKSGLGRLLVSLSADSAISLA